MKWLNLIAVSLQFISFWFVAPELLGSNTLKRMERSIQQLLVVLPNLILLMIILIYAGGIAITGIVKGMQAGEEGITKEEFIVYIISLGLSFAVYGVFLVFFKKIQRYLKNKLAIPLTDKLVNNNETRMLALKIGASLFSLGFLVQIIAIILT